MPLIIITGLPTSGKSTRAKQLFNYLSKRIEPESSSETPRSPQQQQQQRQPQYHLHLISDQTLSISRAVYDLSPEKLPAHTRSANASEKDARAAIYGAVKRALSPRDIVILDGLNYIKGWRYQLYCEAKNLRTPSAVLQIGCGKDRAREVNEARLQRQRYGATQQQGGAGGPSQRTECGDEGGQKDEAEGPYEPANWENLVFRYEEPNAMNRWDSPLFTLVWEDDEVRATRVFDDLWEAIAGDGRKAVRPNQSTVQRGGSTAPAGDYLYVLDRETQDIVRRVLDQQSEDGAGRGEVRIPAGDGDGAEKDLVVELPAGKQVGLPQLQRLRRAFIALSRGGMGLDAAANVAKGRIREGFVGYLNDAFEKEQ